MFNTVFTRALHWSLSWAISIQFTLPSYLSKIHFNIVHPPASWSSQWSLSFWLSHPYLISFCFKFKIWGPSPIMGMKRLRDRYVFSALFIIAELTQVTYRLLINHRFRKVWQLSPVAYFNIPLCNLFANIEANNGNSQSSLTVFWHRFEVGTSKIARIF
jgi:hypothetical protein